MVFLPVSAAEQCSLSSDSGSVYSLGQNTSQNDFHPLCSLLTPFQLCILKYITRNSPFPIPILKAIQQTFAVMHPRAI